MLTALVADAWVCWVTTFALIVISVLFAVANSAFFHPLHARYDPRASFFGTSSLLRTPADDPPERGSRAIWFVSC